MTGLRWGILGLGGIANAFAKDLIANGMIVSAVGSRSLEKAQAFAATHGVETAFGSYQDLAHSPDVDAIYIATPKSLGERQLEDLKCLGCQIL